MICNHRQYNNNNSLSWTPLSVISKDGLYFTMLFTLQASLFKLRPTGRESLRASDSVLLRVRISLRSSSFAATG